MALPENQVRPGQARQGPARSGKGHPGLEPRPVRTRDRPKPGQNETWSCQVSQSRVRVRSGQSQPGPAETTQSQPGQSGPGSVRRQPDQSQSWAPPSPPARHDLSRQIRSGQAWTSQSHLGSWPGLSEPVGQARARQDQASPGPQRGAGYGSAQTGQQN